MLFLNRITQPLDHCFTVLFVSGKIHKGPWILGVKSGIGDRLLRIVDMTMTMRMTCEYYDN